MWEKPRKYVDDKIVQPIKDATSIAITALILAVMAIIIAVVR